MKRISSIDRAIDALPAWLLDRSGSVFYSGLEAFAGQRSLYVIGLNPGGDPDLQRGETIASHVRSHRSRTEPWSAYADESWRGAKPGTWGMQPRMLHMFAALELDPRYVPASNLVFARTRSEAALSSETTPLIDLCWPVHAAAIDQLKVGTIVCLGTTVGRAIRRRMNATTCVDVFEENNRRKWRSVTHRSENGMAVVTVTHPSRADWRNPSSDPTELVMEALRGK